MDQIHKKQECMIKAAALMKDSGFAGVDLHAAHWGYLLDNFLMPIANHREDEYGGCLENRVRVITEMVEGIHQVCGSDFAVTIGLGVKSFITALNKGCWRRPVLTPFWLTLAFTTPSITHVLPAICPRGTHWICTRR